ncbi:MAG: hypothetical protein ACPGJS_14335, partial [Flammeovirgaceae bacterium]
MYINEDNILKEARELINSNNDSQQIPLNKYQKIVDEYETLLSEIKFITKISDRLQNKLNSINENLLEQTIQLESAQKLIMKQNEELKAAKENLEGKVIDRTKELQQANQDLQITNRELDTFVYRASHDIKGPIMTMLGLCNVAEMEAIQEMSKQYFKMLADVARQLQSKLQRLLTINNLKKLTIKSQEFNLETVFNNSITTVSQFKNIDFIDISLKYPEDKIISSDLEVFQILFDNLLEYAVKNISGREREAPFIRMSAKLEKNLQVFMVYNGNKIPENINSEIFRMFYRTNNNPDLTGMELYTANLAAEK